MRGPCLGFATGLGIIAEAVGACFPSTPGQPRFRFSHKRFGVQRGDSGPQVAAKMTHICSRALFIWGASA